MLTKIFRAGLSLQKPPLHDAPDFCRFLACSLRYCVTFLENLISNIDTKEA